MREQVRATQRGVAVNSRFGQYRKSLVLTVQNCSRFYCRGSAPHNTHWIDENVMV